MQLLSPPISGVYTGPPGGGTMRGHITGTKRGRKPGSQREATNGRKNQGHNGSTHTGTKNEGTTGAHAGVQSGGTTGTYAGAEIGGTTGAHARRVWPSRTCDVGSRARSTIENPLFLSLLGTKQAYAKYFPGAHAGEIFFVLVGVVSYVPFFGTTILIWLTWPLRGSES